MGTDDLFHKRKARRARDLCRRKARREPYAKVLIVCEGEKTESNYFNNLKDCYGLNSANVEIIGNTGSAPCNLYDYARQRYREEKDAGDPFDHVYCVFDKDTHDSYEQTIHNLAYSTPKNLFKAITSVPCFEYWLLLHFVYTTRPYNPLPEHSACQQVLRDLEQYIPGYSKGRQGTFTELQSQLEYANENAKRALKAAEAIGTDNPTTRVYELVAFLQLIKQ